MAKKIPIAYREDGTPETTIVLDSLELLKELPREQKPRKKEKKDIKVIREGITAGLIPVEEDGFITREDLNDYFTAHGNGEEGGFKGKGNYEQSDPKKNGICGRLLKKGCLEWIEERKGYLLTDTDSCCWEV
jgi:hypothetical protein